MQNIDFLKQIRHLSDAKENIQEAIHYQIVSHHWHIGDGYSLSVALWSSSPDYFIDEYGSEAARALIVDDLSELNRQIAYWCMYNDIVDQLSKPVTLKRGAK